MKLYKFIIMIGYILFIIITFVMTIKFIFGGIDHFSIFEIITLWLLVGILISICELCYIVDKKNLEVR